ncbi:ABC transporter ATP-binding protein [Paracoccus sanguinis]|uniref:Amino acid/amide ABC transporter ATP-binding protein 2, HAAT family n=1 Tax=Paracoccus sanguinis TaxID=1545044 RepID=A0A1H2XGJ0_9RHOB|nr:ABC transporter ATP-binding protein [Paracoccus sanguinis]KGJ16929.1 ABC transporter ATP-binding protein [Paracoccus sanguinis]QJD16233.1 ABC transporter ATP-binding protein [Paracoccus sanguinis]SDW91876.1 amino acid/amide ABC transporter ATP-binding protein 2, HAAT family [Paracoccus sanguinis]
MSALLETAGLEAGYGPVQALFGVDLALAPGEVLALMGRNGMGKTTTIRAICGLTPPTAGRVSLDGRPLGGLAPHRIARLGVGLVPEGRRCFAPLTVAENLGVAARPGPWDRARVEALFPRLAERRGQRAATLSGGEQQMLAIGRALMTNPRLLILDEATEGLAPVVRQEIWAAIVRLKQDGQSILLVDKSLRELRQIADHAVILERGRSIWHGRLEALTEDQANDWLGV